MVSLTHLTSGLVAMRVHIIGINYRPEQTGISVFTAGRAEHLASRGHDVTVCTAPPYYPHWCVADGYRRYWFGRERRAGVDILRCPLYVPSVVTPFRRVLHEASFIASAFIRSLFARRPDVLFVVSPPLGLALVAIALSVLWRVPYVFDVQDLQPDTALDLGMVKRGRITRLLYAIERLAYRRAACISTITEPMRTRIVAKDVPASKVVHLALWADPELFDLPPRAEEFALRQELGLDETFVVLHAGNLGVKQGLDVVLETARLSTAGAAVQFVLLGDGAAREALEARANALGLSNVRFIRLLSRPRFLRLLATADLCVVAQQRSVADVVFPSKVLTLLAAAKPVVASVAPGSAVATTIQDAEAGIVVTPEDPRALHEAVERLRRDESFRNQLASAGRSYARRHWQAVPALTRFEQILASIAATRPGESARARVPAPPPA